MALGRGASCPSRTGTCWTLALCLLAGSLPGLQAQLVQVNDTISGFVGSDVVLYCSFTNPHPNVKITQVTWQKATNGSKQNVAIFNPTMGLSILPPYKDRVVFQNPSFSDGTIQLSRIQLQDEGLYICEFATFPQGNRESQLNLTVLAKPTNKMEGPSSTLIVTPGKSEKVTVATCISASGKPPSTITWETKLKGETEFEENKNSNGTVTVISRYRLNPGREVHGQELTCVVNYQLDRFTNTTVLDVQYEPEVTIEGFDGNWYLKRVDVKLMCTSDANPPATKYSWRMLNGTLPETAEIQNSTLFFKGPVTYSLAGTYICEATNAIGTRSGLVEVNVTEFPFIPTPPGQQESGIQLSPTIMWVLICLGLLLVLGAIIIVIVIKRRHHTFKGDYSTKKHVYGNGYSKAGVPQPPLPTHSLHYPDDSDDEKKPGPLGGSSYEEDEDERKPGPRYDEEAKRPYFTVEEDTQEYGEDGTLGFQYEPEPVDIAENMVSQNDGSFISKKEWYV
uniref:Nectin-1 n=1 Tax=Geotrypetes seraphini TaxID=260995 RepID=A0A6P8P286_GEOSA|nr:nectin-1 [Geotrypetes seraphini]